MPPRKDFRSKRAFKVVRFKEGKAVKKKQKINIPARLTVHKDFLINETPGLASNSDGPSDEQNIVPSADDLDFPAGGSKISKKWPRFLIKQKLRTYHTRKSRLAKSWLNYRAQIVTAVLSREALPMGQKCVIPGCYVSVRRTHSGCPCRGKSLHTPQAWRVRVLFCIHFQLFQIVV